MEKSKGLSVTRINKLSNKLPFIESSIENRMLVISDGDIAQNHTFGIWKKRVRIRYPYPL